MSGKHEKESHGESLLDLEQTRCRLRIPPWSTVRNCWVPQVLQMGHMAVVGVPDVDAFDSWNIFGEPARGVESNHQATQ